MKSDPTKVDAKMYARVFEGHVEAAMVLDDLTKRFGGALFVKGGEEGRRQTDFNLGRRFVLDFILTMINTANGVDPNVDEAENA